MALERYRQKRDFGTTPEPRGRLGARRKGQLSFVIQKHAASHLHYDFRLELGGVLLSWAVPKGPSLDPQDKRLAMHVEDHPLEYGGFEGVIPPKQYGAGTVMVWDRGTWIPQGDPAEAYGKGRLKFQLDGEKLKGGWTLVRTHGSKYGNGKQAWLLIKENDEFARRGVDAHIVDDEPNSVLSGRSLDAIQREREHVWHSNRSAAENVRAGAVSTKMKTRSARAGGAISLADLAGARKAPLPATLTPTLATLVDEIPAGQGWLHEIKYDGYRMVCRIDRGNVRIFSRNGKDWTSPLGAIAEAVVRLPVKSAWIDGEVTTVDAQGRTSFQVLQNALADPTQGSLTYFVFDVPYLEGYDLRKVPLLERKRVLKTLVPESDPVLRLGVEYLGPGKEFLAQACSLGLEGAVSKRADSPYRDGVRTREWLKVKCAQRQEMVIGGFTDPQGSRSGFGALLLGVYEPDGKLRYSGKVGTGFDDRTLLSLRATLDKLEQDKPPFANPPRGYEAKGAHWVQPKLVGEVSFTEWTQDGTLRHPSFQGLRKDKKATDVVRELPVHEREAGSEKEPQEPPKKPRGAPSARKDDSSATVVAGITLSNPDKIMYPESKYTKRDLARYYEAIGEWIVPHLRDRPLSLVRCPDGWKNQCFYQKHADKSVHASVSRVQVPERDGKATYFAVNSTQAAVALLQWGVLELHPWGSRAPRLDRPDRLIFDFDPDDAVAWKDLVSAVGLLRTLLGDLGLEGFIKTTGGKGLHVVLPIRPTLSWEEGKGFTRRIAELLAGTFPDRFIAVMSKSQRKGKIFIDYLRNAEGSTAIGAYSLRARANAPVATPIAWDELDSDVRFDHFNLESVQARLRKLKRDPWGDFFTTTQTITKAMFKRVGYSS
jgi:bifunctional non-homologous end joining protein LigD